MDKEVENGKEITDQTAEDFGVVVQNMEAASHNVEKITDMVRGNVGVVANAVDQIEKIADVVERNVEISEDTKQASSHMAEITRKLMEIVGSDTF